MALAPKLWNLQDWDRMIGSGLLEDQRVMLLEGEIYEMSPKNDPHSIGLVVTHQALSRALATDTHLRFEMPLYLGRASDPEPDLFVVKGAPREYLKCKPKEALLVVEVSDSSLAFDLGRKAQLYGRHGIPEYWVIDLNGRCLHRHTQPNDLGYALTERVTTEVSWNGHPIPVAELLP